MQWKKPDGEIAPTPSSLSNAGSNVKSTADHALAQFKIKETPGPDQIPTEFLNWLDDDNRKFLLQHYNDMLLQGTYYASLNLANIATIFKKETQLNWTAIGQLRFCKHSTKFLRPCSKTTTVSDVLEPWLSKTQYGFRQKGSTSQPIFIAWRFLDISERQGTNLTLVLLDWKQAFEKIDQGKLVEVLRRLNIPDVIIKAIENIYRETRIFRFLYARVRHQTRMPPFTISLVWL